MADDKGFVSEEATGIYEGTLIEDMIETVRRTGKLVCNVNIPQLFDKNIKYPYVYVPLWAMSLPLRENDKVQVIFNQGDFLYPILYKNPEEFDDNSSFMQKKFEFNKDGDLPSVKDTVSVQQIGKDAYVIKTDDYTIIRQNKGFILMDKDDNVFVKGKKVQIISDKFSVVNPSKTSLFEILKSALTTLNSSLTTAGSPANHTVVPGQFTQQLTQLQQLME